MLVRRMLVPVVVSIAALCLIHSIRAAGPTHKVVYREDGHFAGWPANHGIWSWGEEILVGFEVGRFKRNERGHAIDYSQPAYHALARSLDGGETWTIERPENLQPPAGLKIAGVPTESGGRQPVVCPGGIDFEAPGFVFAARMADIHVGPSRFYYSLDKGKTWSGPFIMPEFGQPGIAARTDYLVDGPRTLTVFLTAAKSNRRQGRPICVQTRDGGESWELIGYVGPEPPEGEKAIMPSSVRISPMTILTARRQRQFIDLFRTDDGGKSWEEIGIAVPDTGVRNGNPPHMIRLSDGRLLVTYGYRSAPYGIKARVSSDLGKTWSDEIVLRDDGGCWDLGYTRTIQRPDGKLVTVYYFNDSEDGERYIGATIWDLDSELK